MLPTIPHDKALHFLYGAVVFSVCYLIASLVLLPALMVAAIAVVVVGVGKEVYDYMHRDKHTPDVMDAIVTILGGAVVAVPVITPFLVNLFSFSPQ